MARAMQPVSLRKGICPAECGRDHRDARERDDQRRMDEYAEAQRTVWDDAPWIFLWVPSFLLVHSARLKGITALPSGKFSAAYAEPV